MPIQFEPLLVSKLQFPRVQKSLLRREHLLSLLDEGLEYTATVIAGPAGSGKTTAVAQWIAEYTTRSDTTQIVYITLDQGDNDPIRFWRYVIAACQKIDAGIGKEALDLLPANRLPPFEPLPLERVLTPLLNDLHRLEHPCVLVLDDMGVIHSQQVSESLAFFLEHLPISFHMFLLVRGELPITLTRLHAHNELLNIHPLSLYFSLEETRTFFERELPFSLSVNTLRQIHQKLEGWPAGIRLLASTLPLVKNKQGFDHTLATFPENYRSIQHYFLYEVLHILSHEQCMFLFQTSVFPRVTAALCDTVLERNDSSQHLATLYANDLFLIPLDTTREWGRYQTLFAGVMQQEARRRLGDEQLQALALSASLWYEQHELLNEAIETALDAGAFQRAVALIQQYIESKHSGTIQNIPEVYTLKCWLERLPREAIEHNAHLCLHYAMMLFFVLMEGTQVSDERERIYHLLSLAEQHWRDANNTVKLAEVFSFHALLARQEGKILQAVTWAKQALAWLPQDNYTWRSTALTVVGTGETLDGSLKNAPGYFYEALRMNERQENIGYARAVRAMLNWVYLEQGELHYAAEQFRQIQAKARAQEDVDDVAHTQSALAGIAYQWNDLLEAQQAAQEVMEIGERLHVEEFQARATMQLALIEHAYGHNTKARQRLLAWPVERPSPTTPFSYQLLREVQAVLAWLSLLHNDVETAEHWLESIQQREEVLPRLQRWREEVLHARLLLAQGNTGTTIERLERLSADAQQTGHRLFWIGVQIVLVKAYLKQNAREKAQQHLLMLLRTTQSENYLRLYTDEGEEIADLLRGLLPHIREKKLLPYVHRILNAFDQASGTIEQKLPAAFPSLLEPLSTREQQVLRLLAAGNSNAEIASELVVSVNTIRTQVQSIYRKLNVNNRVEASAAARSLELVEGNHPLNHP